MPAAVSRQAEFVMLSPSHNQQTHRPWEEPCDGAPKGFLNALSNIFVQFGFSGSRQQNTSSPGMLLRSGNRKSNSHLYAHDSNSSGSHSNQNNLFGEKRSRDNANSNRTCNHSQSADDSEQRIFVSIVVIVVAILFFFGLNSSSDANHPQTGYFTSTPGGLIPSNGTMASSESDHAQRSERNGWFWSWLFSTDSLSGDTLGSPKLAAAIKELEKSNMQKGVLQEDGVKLLKVMSEIKAEQEKIKKDSNARLAEVGARAEKAVAAASSLEEGAARRISALENQVQRLQAALAEKSSTQGAHTAAARVNEVEAELKRDLAAAQEQNGQTMESLRSGLNLAVEAQKDLAAQVVAVADKYEDLEAMKATLVATLDETIRKAVDAALDERRLLKQSESNEDGSKSKTSVVSVLHELYELRTENIDWLLEINGARVEEASQSYINSQSILAAVRWLFPGQQEDPRTVLRPASDGSVAVGAGLVGTEPGRCWAMAGRIGFVKVRLVRPIRPRKLVLQHVPLRASVNQCASAVRNFRLLGWPASPKSSLVEEGPESLQMSPPNDNQGGGPSQAAESPIELVRGRYQIRPGLADVDDDEGRVLGQPDQVATNFQSFEIPAAQDGVLVDRISLEVEDNYGEELFTCLYHPTLFGDGDA